MVSFISPRSTAQMHRQNGFLAFGGEKISPPDRNPPGDEGKRNKSLHRIFGNKNGLGNLTIISAAPRIPEYSGNYLPGVSEITTITFRLCSKNSGVVQDKNIRRAKMERHSLLSALKSLKCYSLAHEVSGSEPRALRVCLVYFLNQD